ncbi:hypothetical protein QQM39_14675 [Streptomyces sp. DT2A-34]|nr:hypothetical protein [Streptomyces sp. DT2A-34]MDO0912042.1 hypothetical protein [Streptomyces sp. DT2A-34]
MPKAEGPLQLDGVAVQGEQPGGGEAFQDVLGAGFQLRPGRRVTAAPSPGAIGRSRMRRAVRACSGVRSP